MPHQEVIYNAEYFFPPPSRRDDEKKKKNKNFERFNTFRSSFQEAEAPLCVALEREEMISKHLMPVPRRSCSSFYASGFQM